MVTSYLFDRKNRVISDLMSSMWKWQSEWVGQHGTWCSRACQFLPVECFYYKSGSSFSFIFYFLYLYIHASLQLFSSIWNIYNYITKFWLLKTHIYMFYSSIFLGFQISRIIKRSVGRTMQAMANVISSTNLVSSLP